MLWYEVEPKTPSCVLSTRVRFARNLENTPFPDHMDEKRRKQVFNTVKTALQKKDLIAVPFDDLDEIEKEMYVDTHLASPALRAGRKGSGLLLGREGDVSIMVNEEDVLRIQVIRSGKAVKEAFEKASELAAFVEEALPVAYRDRFGYLTACPTNLGAAMRVSVLIHLPALSAAGAMSRLVQSLNDAGFTVRGLFGEGSRESGALYQLSNQMSREKTPQQIVDGFEKVLASVEEAETRARKALLERDPIGTEDSVLRAIGEMAYARRLSYTEFIGLYSRVRFGKEAGMPEAVRIPRLDRLLIELMPACMLHRDRTLQSPSERDAARSSILREAVRATE